MSNAAEPKSLVLFTQGPGHHGICWDASDRTFGYSPRFGLDHGDRRSGTPGASQWERFWTILDALGVWQWNGYHGEEGICDGGDWDLFIEHNGRSIHAAGTYAERLPRYFDLFERSLEALVGMPRRPQFATLFDEHEWNLESLDELLRLAEIVRAAIDKSPRAPGLVRECIEQGKTLGGTLLELLSELGSAKSSVLPSLIAHLQGDDEQSFWNLLALKNCGSEASAAIPALLEVLDSRSRWQIVDEASRTLIAIDPDDPRILALLPPLLKHEHQSRRLMGLHFLAASQAPTDEMLALLAERFDETDPIILDSAIHVLRSMCDRRRLLEFLQRPVRGTTLVRNFLQRRSEKTGRMLEVLASLGELGHGELPEIISCLKDPSPFVRKPAVYAVCQIAQPREAAALVSELLNDPDYFTRTAVPTYLAELGVGASVAIPKLLSFIEQAPSVEGHQAVQAICKILGDKRDIAIAFRPLLKRDRPETRAAAIRAIGQCRGDSDELIDVILDACNDPSDMVRSEAVLQLSGLSGRLADLALPALCEALRDPKTCSSAASAISSLRDDGVPAIGAMIELLESGTLQGMGAFCVARTLYELSPEFAEQCPPEVVERLTRFGCHPIWRSPQ
jgi:HEAT repeat protein